MSGPVTVVEDAVPETIQKPFRTKCGLKWGTQRKITPGLRLGLTIMSRVQREWIERADITLSEGWGGLSNIHL